MAAIAVASIWDRLASTHLRVGSPVGQPRCGADRHAAAGTFSFGHQPHSGSALLHDEPISWARGQLLPEQRAGKNPWT